MHDREHFRLDDLDVLQHGGGVVCSIQSKGPLKGAIIQSDQAIAAAAPLRLTPQEHLNSRPGIRFNLEIIHLRRDIDLKAEGCSIVGGLVDDLSLRPVMCSPDQFFVLLPVTLSK